ncbi:MAG: hypothetical protein AAF492_12265, partial [Verrucomicrobiota bacterium]
MLFNIEFNPAAAQPVAAHLIEGTSVEAWVREICSWGVPMADLTGYLVPAGEAFHEVAGLLVLSGELSGVVCSPLARPYTCLAGRLYIPARADLVPAASGEEIREAFRVSIGLFHPAHGLIAYQEDEGFRIDQLFASPRVKSGVWNRAHPGRMLNDKLVSIGLVAPPSIDEFVEASKGDIGSASVQDLPPAPNEPAPGRMAGLRRKTKASFARSVYKLTELAPTTATQPTWINVVQDWASKQLEDSRVVDQAARNRELHRLLHLLKEDPDKGLKFALPIGGDPGARGFVGGSHRLGLRKTDFQLDQLGGGRPVSEWNLDWDQQAELRRRYHDLATRELSLRRYRRAAYIFAQLLGDYASAGNALEQGGYYREAAALYQDHLHNTYKAAECLERGGLCVEAIELYENL